MTTQPLARCVATTIVLALICGASDTGAQRGDPLPLREWERVQSPHFTVVGDVSARELRRVAEQMEQFHELLGLVLERRDLRVPDTTVIVFKNRRKYDPFQPTYQGAAVQVAGYFSPGAMNYVTLVSNPEGDYQSVVYHEYVHLVLNAAIGVMPPWMAEGLAEFYGNTKIAPGGKSAQLGNIAQYHIWQLQKEMLPLQALAGVTKDSPFYNERDKSSVFYAESWALIHYLQLGQQRKYSQKTGAFLDGIANRQTIDQAAQAHLGITGAQLEEELRQYLHAPTLQRLIVKLSDKIDQLERLPAVKVPEADANATLGDLLTHLGNPKGARLLFEHATTLDEAQPLALAGLAKLSADEGAADRARELAARAGGGGSATFLSHFYVGEALEQIAKTPADKQLAADAYRQSVRLNASFDQGKASLAWLRTDSPDGLAEARTLYLSAIGLAPAREDYHLNLARVLMMQSNHPGARSILGPLLARGSSQNVRTAARELLAIAARLENETTAASGAPDSSAAMALASLPSFPPAVDRPLAPGTPEVRLELRPIGPAEVRASGRLMRIDCSDTGVVLVVSTEAGELRIAGPALPNIDFISYRADLKGSVNCGVQAPAMPVLVTYGLSPDLNVAGEVAAVEFVPDGYRPPGL